MIVRSVPSETSRMRARKIAMASRAGFSARKDTFGHLA
jgi:hypothetical protein